MLDTNENKRLNYSW